MISLIEYRESIYLAGEGSFYGLIMAAMRNADTDNLEKLKTAFPEVQAELQARYIAPGGCLTESEHSWLARALKANGNEEESDD